MKLNHKRIAAKIAKITGICDEGKKDITDLLMEFGYKPPKPKTYMPDGVYINTKEAHTLVVKNNRYILNEEDEFAPLLQDFRKSGYKKVTDRIPGWAENQWKEQFGDQ